MHLHFLDTLIELAEGAAFLFGIAYALSWSGKVIGGDSWRHNLLSGAILGFAAIIGMITSITLGEGVIFDARSILISVGSAIGGPLVAIAATVPAALYRLYLGGPGTVSGVGVIVTSAMLGIGFHWSLLARNAKVGVLSGLAFGFVVHGVAVAWFMTIPGQGYAEIFFSIGLPMWVVFTPATAFFCYLLNDLNERIVQREELKGAKRRYEELYQQSPNAYFVLEPGSGRITDASESAELMTGIPRNELRRMKVEELLELDNLDRKTRDGIMEKILSNKPLKGLELRLNDERSRPAWVSISTSQPPQDDSAAPGIRLMMDDISELKSVKTLLADSRALFSKAGAVGHIGSFELDLSSKTVHYSDEARNLLNQEQEQAVSLDSVMQQIHADDRARVTAALNEAIDQGQPWDGKFRIMDDAGNQKWIHCIGSPDSDDGSTTRLVGIIQDITRQKNAEQKLLNLRKKSRKYETKYTNALIGTVNAIALTVEKRDPYTAGHMSRVSVIATAIAQKMGLDQHRIDGLKLAAEIHDLGKIYIPGEILNRPGRLRDEEFQLIKTHSQIGYEIIQDVDFPWPVATIIVQHHERLDGSGYPGGLKGDEILLESRIIAVADVLEAITSHRPYRPALGLEKGLDIIKQGRGRTFDADVVDACVELVESRQLVPGDAF